MVQLKIKYLRQIEFSDSGRRSRIDKTTGRTATNNGRQASAATICKRLEIQISYSIIPMGYSLFESPMHNLLHDLESNLLHDLDSNH